MKDSLFENLNSYLIHITLKNFVQLVFVFSSTLSNCLNTKIMYVVSLVFFYPLKQVSY